MIFGIRALRAAGQMAAVFRRTGVLVECFLVVMLDDHQAVSTIRVSGWDQALLTNCRVADPFAYANGTDLKSSC
jgi:hypothetical protein